MAVVAAALASAACGGDVESSGDAPKAGVGAQEIAGPAPDYIVSAMTEPPAAATNGASFAIDVMVQNIGTADAQVSSRTRYFLSTDAVSGGDRAFAAFTVVAPLAVGASDARSVTLTIPSLPSGSYHVIACADRTAVIAELDNRNNCTASAGTIAITGPDLVVEALSEPPPVALPFSSLSIADTTRNAGAVAAASSTVAYFLSSVPTREAGAARLSPSRAASALAPGAASSGEVTVFVPLLPPGAYFLLACADVGKRVVETDEQNNCRASAGTLTIPAADLAIASLGEPPASIAAGDTLQVAVTTANQGNLPAAVTATRLFLSSDQQVGDDLPVVGSRLVPALAGGATAPLTAHIAVARSTPAGAYFLIACADGAGAVPEFSESNNCRASTGQVAVTALPLEAAEVTVQLLGRDLWGDPQPGQQVLAHAADGSLAARVATDAAGTAQVTVPPGGSLTVVELQTREIATFLDVESGDVLTVGDFGRLPSVATATIVVPVGPFPANQYVIEGPCLSGGIATSESIEVTLFDCPPGPVPVMATLQGPSQERELVGYLYDPEVDVTPGGTAVMDGEWLPPSPFPVDVTGFYDRGLSLTDPRMSSLEGPDRVHGWGVAGVGETLQFADGRLLGSLLHGLGGDGLLTELLVTEPPGRPLARNRILEYRLTDLTSMVGDISDDFVTVPSEPLLLQGELEPGGPTDVTGVQWDMIDGAAVDGMLIWIEKFREEMPAYAWTVVLPPRPIGPTQLLLPRLPPDLVSVWAGDQINYLTISAVDSLASSYAEFRVDADPQREFFWRLWRPTVPGKVRIGSSN